MLNKLKLFLEGLNKKGIPLPLFRIGGVPTLTGTMTVLSFMTALVGQLGRISNFLGNVDLTQANYLFLICLGAYLGNKKLVGDGKSVTLEEINKEEK